MGMDTSVRVARGMTRGRKGRGLRGAIGDTDSRSTSGPDPVAGDIRIVTNEWITVRFKYLNIINLPENILGIAGTPPQPPLQISHHYTI